jgi:hypothetical protein
MDILDLGFPLQPTWMDLAGDLKRAYDEGTIKSKDQLKTIADTLPAARIISGDVDFLTLYFPSRNWKQTIPPSWKIQPGYDEERFWWKGEIEAKRMVLFGPAVEGPDLGSVMVGWLCPTLEEAKLLASRSPWVANDVVRVFVTTRA